MICEFITFHMHHDCVKENEKEKFIESFVEMVKKKNDDKSKKPVRGILKRE